MRHVVRFGYDGLPFAGWARQPGRRTVEGAIREGLVRQGLRAHVDPASLEVASRTDRGVSARANALALESDLAPAALLRALNGIAPEIYFTACGPVPRDFRVRSAVRRIYRYFEPGRHAVDRWNTAARRLVGALDVRSFGRALPRDTPTLRTVESIRVRPRPGGIVVEVAAPSFVWGQVRKMVAALRAVERGDLTEPDLAAAARGAIRLTLPLAEPEGLLLWEVELPVGWESTWTGPNRRQRAFLQRSAELAWSRAQILGGFPRAPGGPARGPGARPNRRAPSARASAPR